MAVLVPIDNCTQCPHCNTKLTKGYGYATDYHCGATYDNKKIVGYVEWDSEIPKEPPKWCPFRNIQNEIDIREVPYEADYPSYRRGWDDCLNKMKNLLGTEF